MEAVTSVLLERARHDAGLPRMVSASLVGHVALIAGLVAASAIGGRLRGPDEREVMTISLGGAPSPNAGGMTMMGGPARSRVEAPPAEPTKPSPGVITAVQKAAEEKDIGEVLEHLSKAYRDPQEHDYNGIKGLLLMYFYRHERVSVYIPGIEVTVTEASARAVFEAVLTVAGTPESRPGILPEARGVYSFDVSLKKEGKDWKILSAAWQRSGEGGR